MHRFSHRFFVRIATFIVLGALGVPLLGAGNDQARTLVDLAYASDANPKRKLDLYLPADRLHAPVIVFVHGGAFTSGDRRDYTGIGEALAHAGFAVAIPSYRLFPETDAAGATADVASAVAWVAKNGNDYGIDATKLVLAGHSAGGQIVAMLATHRRFLAAARVAPSVVRGAFVAGSSYDVRDLSGASPEWIRLDEALFGATAEQRATMSAIAEIDPGTPSILAVCGTHDAPGSCERTRAFTKTLTTAGVSCDALEVDANHMDLVRRLAITRDPLSAALQSFARQKSR